MTRVAGGARLAADDFDHPESPKLGGGSASFPSKPSSLGDFAFMEDSGSDLVPEELFFVRCHKCKNTFWCEHADLDLPRLCPYCGVEFQCVQWATVEKIRQILREP